MALTVSGLNDGFGLYQRSPMQVIYGEPIEPGGSVEVLLEYYSAESGTPPDPTLAIIPILPQPQLGAGTKGIEVAQMTITADGAILLEFGSESGARYVVQYSFDMVRWFNSPALVSGQTGRSQWLDQGFPRTSCHPSVCRSRFYRVLKVIESE